MDKINVKQNQSFSLVSMDRRGLASQNPESSHGVVQVELRDLSAQENPLYVDSSYGDGGVEERATAMEGTPSSENKEMTIKLKIAYDTATQKLAVNDVAVTENTIDREIGTNENSVNNYQEISDWEYRSTDPLVPVQVPISTARKIYSFWQGKVEVGIRIAIILVSETQSFQYKAYTCSNIYIHTIHVHMYIHMHACMHGCCYAIKRSGFTALYIIHVALYIYALYTYSVTNFAGTNV